MRIDHFGASPMKAPRLQSAPKQDVVVLGAGGHARVLVEAMVAQGFAIRGYVTNEIEVAIGVMAPFKRLGDDHTLLDVGPKDVVLVNGIGSTGRADVRREVFLRFRQVGFHFATVVHPSAIIGLDVTIGEGTQVMAGAVVQPGVKIGENVIINTGALVDHDVSLGNHVHVAPGVCLGGHVTVGDSAHIGTGASVIQNRQIGDRALVGAGAVVVSDVPANTLVMGVPAKAIGYID